MHILIIILVLGLIGLVIDFLSEYGTVIIGILVVILVIGIIIAIFPLIISLLPYIIGILLIWRIIKLAFNFSIKRKAHSYLEYLNTVGVSQLNSDPVNKNILKWIEKQGSAVRFLNDYLISRKFCEEILEQIGQQMMVQGTQFQNCCLRAAPKFCKKYTSTIIRFLEDTELLFSFSSLSGKKCYLSAEVIKTCEHLFEKEGAATKSEFAEICRKSFAESCLYKEYNQLAMVTLKNMKSHGIVCKVDLGETELYKLKKYNPNSKFTIVNISLDD